MKLKVEDVINVSKGIGVLLEAKLPLRVTRRVRDIAVELNAESDKVNSNLSDIQALEDDEEKGKELKEYLNEEVELKAEKIPFKDIENVEMTSGEYSLIESVVVE